MKTKILVGSCAQMKKTVTEEAVEKMAELSGDNNPIHLDEVYAKATRFHGRIAHGLFCISMISAILGNDLPGKGTIIISESIEFKRPVYIGDEITALVRIEKMSGKRATLSLLCRNQKGEEVLTGSTEVIIDSI